jgi:hypothetical protein
MASVDHNLNRPVRTPNRVPKLLPTSLDLHEEAVRGNQLSKDAKLLGDARAPLKAARELREQVNQLIPTNVSRAELARAATSRLGDVAKLFDKVVPALEAHRTNVEKEIGRILTPGTPDALAAEVRAHLKASKEPFAEALKLVEGGDLRSVQAVMAGPGFLSGMTPEQAGLVRDAARTRFAADHAELAADLDRAIGSVKRSGEALIRDVGGAINEWTDPSTATINRVMGS